MDRTLGGGNSFLSYFVLKNSRSSTVSTLSYSYHQDQTLLPRRDQCPFNYSEVPPRKPLYIVTRMKH